MSKEARRAVVAALIELGGSPSYQDRADAGRSLASFVDDPDARDKLLGLLLDAEDTFVTRVTAAALFRRQDAVGLRVVASALAVADSSHDHWIDSAVREVFMVFARERDAAVRECATLTRDPDDDVRTGAAE